MTTAPALSAASELRRPSGQTPASTSTSARGQLDLPLHDVHVWAADLRALAHPRFAFLLAPHELERARHFRLPRERDRFVTARGALRELLSWYLAVPAATLELRWAGRGSTELAVPELIVPECVGGVRGAELCLSVAQAHEQALFAFSRRRALGVDARHFSGAKSSARTSGKNGTWEAASGLTPREAAELRALPAAKRPEAVSRRQARLACLRAAGSGGAARDHAGSSAGSSAVSSAGSSAEAGERWLLFDVPLGAGYAAALAVEALGEPPEVRMRRLD